MSRPAPRIKRLLQSPRGRPTQRRANSHLQFLRGLPCMACGRAAPSEAAHVRKGSDGATAQKPGDKFGIPLCHSCHTRQHQKGELAFWSALGIDPVDQATRLWTVSGDEQAATRILFRAQQRILLIALKRKAAVWG